MGEKHRAGIWELQDATRTYNDFNRDDCFCQIENKNRLEIWEAYSKYNSSTKLRQFLRKLSCAQAMPNKRYCFCSSANSSTEMLLTNRSKCYLWKEGLAEEQERAKMKAFWPKHQVRQNKPRKSEFHLTMLDYNWQSNFCKKVTISEAKLRCLSERYAYLSYAKQTAR